MASLLYDIHWKHSQFPPIVTVTYVLRLCDHRVSAARLILICAHLRRTLSQSLIPVYTGRYLVCSTSGVADLRAEPGSPASPMLACWGESRLRRELNTFLV